MSRHSRRPLSLDLDRKAEHLADATEALLEALTEDALLASAAGGLAERAERAVLEFRRAFISEQTARLR